MSPGSSRRRDASHAWRALLALGVACAAAACTASGVALVRREQCETGTAPAHGRLSRGDACAYVALEEDTDPAEAVRHFAMGCAHGSALACHYALAAVPEARNDFLEGAGAPAAGPVASLPLPELVALRESAARVCVERAPRLRVCVGAALLFARVEPRDEARSRDLLAHRCRTAGDCALYRLRFEDRDGDTVLDRDDRCPDVLEDLDGRNDDDGCPDLDEDGDARRDDEDLCPDEAEDVDGFEDHDGCIDPDDDGDGVLDAADACPREAETRNGHRDEDGCPDVAPHCACRFVLAAEGDVPACAAGPSDECTYATLGRQVDALACIERTAGCPTTALTAAPQPPLRDQVLRVHTAQLAVSERLRARPRNARTLRAYGDALEREGEALALVGLHAGRAGTAGYSEEALRAAMTRALDAHEASVRARARLAPEDRDALEASAGAPAPAP